MLSGVPAVRLGGPFTDDATLFVRPVRLVVGPDGDVYVIDAGTLRVSVFTADGSHVRSFGGPGEGPGEFTVVSDGGFVGDTLWILDAINRRTTFFSTAGQPLRTRVDTLTIDGARFTSPALPIGYLTSQVALYEQGAHALAEHRLDATAPVVLAGRGSRVLDTVATRTVWRDLMPVPQLGILRVSIPGDYPLVASDPRGVRFVVVKRGATARTPHGEITVSLHRPPGFETTTGQLDFFESIAAPAAVSDTVTQRAVRALERTMAQLPDLRREISNPEKLVRSVLRIPGALPAVEGVRLTGDDLVWLQLAGWLWSAGWLVLDATASSVAVVEFPTGFEFQDYALGRAWGFEFDSLEVPYVVGLDVELPM